MLLLGTVRRGRNRGGQKKRWNNNITEWAGTKLNETFKLAKDRDGWRELVDRSSVAQQLPRDRSDLHSAIVFYIKIGLV
jgi:hypothetical protein